MCAAIGPEKSQKIGVNDGIRHVIIDELDARAVAVSLPTPIAVRGDPSPSWRNRQIFAAYEWKNAREVGMILEADDGRTCGRVLRQLVLIYPQNFAIDRQQASDLEHVLYGWDIAGLLEES
jgi:hypothetical protein